MPFVVTNPCFGCSEAFTSGLLLQHYCNLYYLDRRAKRDALGRKTFRGHYIISEWVLFKNESIPVATWYQSKVYSKRVISEWVYCSFHSRIENWEEIKVRQNFLASDYELYMVCLLVATVYWHKSLQFVKKKHNTITLYIYDFMSCFDDHVMLYHILARSEFQILYLLHLIISVARQAWHI